MKNAALFGFSYLFLVPIYALFYAMMPLDFISSTSKFDPNLQKTVWDFDRSLRIEFEKCNNRIFDVSFGLHLEDQTVYFSAYNPEKHSPSIIGGIKLYFRELITPGQAAAAYPYPWSSRRVLGDFGSKHIMQPFHLESQTLTDEHIKVADEINRCFNPKSEWVSEDVYNQIWSLRVANKETPQVDFGLDFEIRLLELISSYQNGYDAAAPNHYLRALYFSVVTITTLGYGDVLPVSDRAKALVASQSIIGVVLIGLFLNALASNPRPPQNALGGVRPQGTPHSTQSHTRGHRRASKVDILARKKRGKYKR